MEPMGGIVGYGRVTSGDWTEDCEVQLSNFSVDFGRWHPWLYTQYDRRHRLVENAHLELHRSGPPPRKLKQLAHVAENPKSSKRRNSGSSHAASTGC